MESHGRSCVLRLRIMHPNCDCGAGADHRLPPPPIEGGEGTKSEKSSGVIVSNHGPFTGVAYIRTLEQKQPSRANRK